MPDSAVIPASLLEDLPRPAAQVLEELVAALVETAGSQLDSVILFGSGAEGRLRSTSDLNPHCGRCHRSRAGLCGDFDCPRGWPHPGAKGCLGRACRGRRMG